MPGQPAGEHRLAGAGWPGEEHVVAAGGCDLECPARTLLAANVTEIRHGLARDLAER